MFRQVLRYIATIILLAAIGWAVTARAADAPRPNILFILADDVGQEVLGCYGGQSYETPHLDALARSGTLFRHGYAMPVCHPTRITLLLGRYPFRFGSGWGSFPKPEEPRTLAHVLRDAGYTTAVAGKWQLTLLKKDTDHPHRLGFDEYSLFGWHEGPRYWRPMIWENGKVRDDVKDRYGPEVYTDFLIDFMKRSRQAGRPFFAFYSMALCHDVTDDLKEPVPFAPGKDRYETYAEMAENMDRMVGKLVAAVERMGLRDNTLIIFTSDNGTAQRSITYVRDGKLVRVPVVSKRDGGEVPGGKGTLGDTGTRVPLIASWPGVTPTGAVADDLVDVSDYLPTFAELAGGSPPDGVELDGRSFGPALRGESGRTRPWVYAERGDRWWVRDQRWKLYSDGKLFDVQEDGQEKRAIGATDQSADAAAARQRLNAALKELGRSPNEPRP